MAIQRAGRVISGQAIISGYCCAPVLILEESFSFWGGLDPETGRIIDKRHPQFGKLITGRVLVLPGTRGSTSAPCALVEAIRLRKGPAAIVLKGPEPIVLVAVRVASELYGLSIPVVVLELADFEGIRNDQTLIIQTNGRILVETRSV
jgi:predicted aconitase with swiveling domain